MKHSKGLRALTVEDELKEIEAVFGPKVVKMKWQGPTIRLKRTFDMFGYRFWRVNCPGHPNHDSDLSEIGLKEWGII